MVMVHMLALDSVDHRIFLRPCYYSKESFSGIDWILSSLRSIHHRFFSPIMWRTSGLWDTCFHFPGKFSICFTMRKHVNLRLLEQKPFNSDRYVEAVIFLSVILSPAFPISSAWL